MKNEFTNDEKRDVFTIRNVIRGLMLLCAVFVFCPSFLVSCSGRTIEVDIMTAVEGVSGYGDTVVEPHPIMLLCLIIPGAIFLLLFLKMIPGRVAAVFVFGCAVVDWGLWCIFRMKVKEISEINYCTFETTPWYMINMIFLSLTILLSVLVIVGLLKMDINMISNLSGDCTRESLGKMPVDEIQLSNIATQEAGVVPIHQQSKKSQVDVIGYCAICGSAIVYGHKFCTTCGTAVPEDMTAKAEESRKVRVDNSSNSKSVFCGNCGAKLDSDDMFCRRCGTSIKGK